MQWHMPVGYKVVNGKITIYKEHRRIVEEIFHNYDNGISTLRIAENLKAGGICNAHDRVAWTHASIGKILENHNYLGTEYYPQIIDTELFERVQKRREQESHHLHVHLVVYSANLSEGYLTKKDNEAMRSAYAHDILKQCGL